MLAFCDNICNMNTPLQNSKNIIPTKLIVWILSAIPVVCVVYFLILPFIWQIWVFVFLIYIILKYCTKKLGKKSFLTISSILGGLCILWFVFAPILVLKSPIYVIFKNPNNFNLYKIISNPDNLKPTSIIERKSGDNNI